MLGGNGMTVDSKATEVQAPKSRLHFSNPTGLGQGKTSPPLGEQLLSILSEDSPRFLATAPGRLDVLGGSAEYTGSLIVNVPLAEHVTVAAQRRSDGKIHITSIRLSQDNGHENVVAAFADFSTNGSIATDSVRAILDGIDSATARSATAALAELVRAGMIRGLEDGVTLAIGSTLHEVSDGGVHAAVVAAAAVALARAFDAQIDPLATAELCQSVENEWLQSPVGMGDAMCALFGESGAFLQVASNPRRPDGTIPFPDGLEIVGLDSGVRQEAADSKYARVRCASFMGRTLIDRIIKHDDPRLQWNGQLASVSIADYVDCFRDRLPTKLSGKEYLERFGETGDPWTRVDPDFAYKIRSRTEHHIYEHARSTQFVECLARSIRTRTTSPLREAGELMFASHWSYGQRCGLGSVETDFLVTQIRKINLNPGIYGAKITGRGCGGVVAVLLQPSDEVFESLRTVQQLYEARTGNLCRLLRGSIPGAWVSGAQKF